MGHGAGGEMMHELISKHIIPFLGKLRLKLAEGEPAAGRGTEISKVDRRTREIGRNGLRNGAGVGVFAHDTGQRGRCDRHSNFGRSCQGCILWVLDLLKMPENVLQDDNPIINHHAYG